MKVLITGVAGFIGSNAVEYFCSQGDSVVGIDNFTSYYSRKIKEHNVKDVKGSKNFIFLERDLSDEKQMSEIFKKYKFDAVVNLAGWAGVTQSVNNPLSYVHDNVYGAVNLMEQCRHNGVLKFVQVGTSSEYGDNKIPWKEDMNLEHQLHPYAASKRAAQIFGYHYFRNFGIDFTTTVFFNVYGIRQRPDMLIPVMFRHFLNDKPFPQYQGDETGRDYTYVTDIVRALYLATHKKTGYERINLGNSNPTTMGDVKKAVKKAVGGEVKFEMMEARIGEAEMTYADSSKAKKTLGWEPEYNINQGIQEHWDWFKKQPNWYKYGNY